jgi:hypothetical protein
MAANDPKPTLTPPTDLQLVRNWLPADILTGVAMTSLRPTICALTSLSLIACSAPVYEGIQPTMKTRYPPMHMEEAARTPIETVVVMPHTEQVELLLFGTYDRPTPTITEGVIAGTTIPLIIAMDAAASDLGKVVPPELLIPVIILPGVLIGASVTKTTQEIQDFRDGLTDVLVESASPPLANMTLARDVYSSLRHVKSLNANVIAETTPLPEGTDTVLLAAMIDAVIDIQGGHADITTGAMATLRRVADGKVLWRNYYYYQDKDTLKNWTKDDAAAWVNYINFARHYFGRQITADFFEQYELRHDLYPVPTDTVQRIADDNWRGISKSQNPTLSWKLVLMGRDAYGPWTSAINEDNTFYDLEIYDERHLVYSAKELPETHHDIPVSLDGCNRLWWTVRPSYYVGGKVRFGEWMRFYTRMGLDDGHVGTNASDVPAFLSGFARLDALCRKT